MMSRRATEAKMYLKARHRILYESRIWRDAIDPPLLLSGRMLTNEFGEPLMDENGQILTAGLVDQILILPAIVAESSTAAGVATPSCNNEEMWNMIRLDPTALRSDRRPDRILDDLAFRHAGLSRRIAAQFSEQPRRCLLQCHHPRAPARRRSNRGRPGRRRGDQQLLLFLRPHLVPRQRHSRSTT